jgi:hypothetical protein
MFSRGRWELLIQLMHMVLFRSHSVALRKVVVSMDVVRERFVSVSSRLYS